MNTLRFRTMTRISALVTAGMFILLPLSTAHAVAPLDDISTPVVDTVGALDKAEVEMAIQRVEDATDYRLNVVFADSFDGMSGARWAVQSAAQSGLVPTQDILFAVATVERSYGSAYPEGTSIARAITQVEDEALPYLSKGEWTNAVVAYADAVIDVHNGALGVANLSDVANASGSVTPREPMDWSGFLTVLKYLGFAILGMVLMFSAYVAYRTNKARTALKSTYATMSKQIALGLVEIDALVKKVETEIDYFSAEFPSFDARAAHKTVKVLGNRLADTFKLSNGDFADPKIALRERVDEGDGILAEHKNIRESIEATLSDFDTKREEARSIRESIPSVKSRADALSQRVVTTVTTLEEMSARLDSSALSGAVKATTSAQQSIANAQSRLDKVSRMTMDAPGMIVAEVKAAEKDMQTAEDHLDNATEMIASITRAPQEAREIMMAAHASISFFNQKSERMQAGKRQVSAMKKALDTYSTHDFTSGNPVKEVGALESTYQALNSAEGKVRESEIAIKRATNSYTRNKGKIKKQLMDTARFYEDNTRYLSGHDAPSSNKSETVLAHAESQAQAGKIISANEMLSKEVSRLEKEHATYTSAVAAVKRKEHEEKVREQRRKRAEEQRRLAAINAASFAASSHSMNHNSFGGFGGSGGSFGGSGGSFGGGFGGSGGSFGGSGGSGGSF